MKIIRIILIIICLCPISASIADSISDAELAAVFQDAKKVDLSTSKATSVVTLREIVKIPPPSTLVLVKTFKRNSLPEVLKPIFANPGTMGVTINGKYIAILHTEFHKEYEDVLRHELVHAYITMVSPKPLPSWFQEGSAVHFSMNKEWKFYGQPSKTQLGVMVGRTVELPNEYKQKLHSFQFLIERVGDEKFYKWYKKTVVTGVVDTRSLLGLKPASSERASFKRPFPIWLGAIIGAAVIIVAVIGYYSSKRSEYY